MNSEALWLRSDRFNRRGSARSGTRATLTPGAANIPWGKNVNTDTGQFLPAAELKKLYEENGITPDKEIVAYCRIGERSALTWLVLHELLGYPKVRNYDGSWTEWGSLVGAPIEK